MTDKRFAHISTEAKFLYGLLLDWTNFSRKSGWVDDENRIYIIYSLDEIIEDIHYSRQKVVKLLDELDSKKGVGLIVRVRRGMNLPNLIYVKNFASVLQADNWKLKKQKDEEIELRRYQNPSEWNFQKYETQTSESMKSELPEVPKSYSNNTYLNNNYMNKNHPPPLCELQGRIEQLLDGPKLNEEEKDRLRDFSVIVTDIATSENNFRLQLSNHTVTRDELMEMLEALNTDDLIHLIQTSGLPTSNPKKYWATVLYHEHLRIKAGIPAQIKPQKKKPLNYFHNFHQRDVNYEDLIWPDNFPPKKRNVSEG